ncbi:MAG TPA: GNAT family N-acetyltransferase, partial [Acetobacteraceae bacterium]|nr:GNAT family N-acetyltransferase [Acetobacteraceae bacterium]
AQYGAEMRPLLAGTDGISGDAAARLIEHDPAILVLAALVEEAPVGFAILFDLPEVVFARRCGVLDDLFVAPGHRGQGIAGALVEAAVRLGCDRGWSHLRWIVPGRDAAAIALYERIAERADWRSYVIRLARDASL